MSKKRKKQVDGIVSGMGVFMSIITSLVELIKKFGGTMEDLYRLATPEGRETLEEVARVIAIGVIKLQDYMIWWQEFYREEGIEVDFGSFKIPEKPEGDWWLIIITPGMTYSRVIQAMRKKFKVWSCNEDLDRVIDLEKEQRKATNKTYAVWVKANIGADPELKDKSANDLSDMSVITLLERLLLEVYYFSFVSNGDHLDVKKYTLCAGSRRSDGSVFYVYFRRGDGEVRVDWTHPNFYNDFLRSRQAVS